MKFFVGRSLSVGSASSIMVAPTNVSEAVRLKGWYEREGRFASFETFKSDTSSVAGTSGTVNSSGTLGGWHILQDVKSSGVGTNVKPDYFTVKVSFIKWIYQV